MELFQCVALALANGHQTSSIGKSVSMTLKRLSVLSWTSYRDVIRLIHVTVRIVIFTARVVTKSATHQANPKRNCFLTFGKPVSSSVGRSIGWLKYVWVIRRQNVQPKRSTDPRKIGLSSGFTGVKTTQQRRSTEVHKRIHSIRRNRFNQRATRL